MAVTFYYNKKVLSIKHMDSPMFTKGMIIKHKEKRYTVYSVIFDLDNNWLEINLY